MVEGGMCVCKRLMRANKGGENIRSNRCMGVWNEKFPLKGLLTLSDSLDSVET